MSEREKEIVKKLAETVPNLDADKQHYILGVAEGMAIARENDDEVEDWNTEKIVEKKVEICGW